MNYTNTNLKILLVDDEEDVLEFLGYNLKTQGYLVYTAKNGEKAIEIAKEIVPHLIVLDVMMPRMDGIETCERLRSIPVLSNSIIMFLTARGEDYSQVAGFEAGADDYITKPIKPKVFLSRVKALLKRSTQLEKRIENSVESTVSVYGNLSIDVEKYQVQIGEEALQLPRKEFELLYLLVSKADKVFTRDEIYNNIWGENIVVGDRTIDVHIRKLREKIGEDRIRTIKGVGYKFEP